MKKNVKKNVKKNNEGRVRITWRDRAFLRACGYYFIFKGAIIAIRSLETGKKYRS